MQSKDLLDPSEKLLEGFRSIVLLSDFLSECQWYLLLQEVRSYHPTPKCFVMLTIKFNEEDIFRDIC